MPAPSPLRVLGPRPKGPDARRRARRVLLAGCAGALALLAQHDARAQAIDVSPPLPNALILLDTSGSMEKMIDGSDPGGTTGQGVGQACGYKMIGSSVVATGNGPQTSPNRWGVAVQALTGDIYPYYACVEMPRDKGSAFDNEYKINGYSPYDVDYILPYRRPVANGATLADACVVGPGTMPTPAVDFPASALKYRKLNDPNTTCTFTQSQNGVLDAARDMIRFGLMTFDGDTNPATAVATPGPLAGLQLTGGNPFLGEWSYYPGWNTGGVGASGKPADCAQFSDFEVGARSPIAPPWEGRFIMLPSDPNAPINVLQAQNDRIQATILAARPTGATPIAGMLEDAKYYFWSDPAGPQQTDPYLVGGPSGQGCRDEYIILVTDGAPNLDLRPACAKAPVDPSKPGACPYKKPEDIALELATGGSNKHPVKTFVIGFAVSQNLGNGIAKCSDLVVNNTLSAKCQTVTSIDDPIAPCCTLQSIALQGGTGSAYFADTPGDLNKALGAIIAQIAQNTTSRTVPAYSPVVSAQGGTANATAYLSSFAPIPGRAWVGNVQRQRYVCTLQGGSFVVPPPVVDESAGDDFAKNLNLPGAQANRHFRSFMPATTPAVDSSATIRPKLQNNNDRLGQYGGTLVGGDAAAIRNGLTPQALSIGATSCPNSTNTQYLSTTSCKNLALNYAMAEPTTDAMPNYTFPPFVSRAGYALGDIFRSTPTVVPPPSALVRDESYNVFATANASRKTVLYTATNDGLLHAFDTKVDSTTREKGELWAFMPPAVLPKLLSVYPGSHQMLLDGPPVVKDVVFDRTESALGVGGATAWHTVLVAGFGAGNAGYYALDVTDPAPNTDLTKGPQFLWQITKNGPYNGSPDRQLFGASSGTPAITTVFIDDGNGPHEVGVAILPGGLPGGPTGGPCPRAGAVGQDAAPATGYQRRSSVRCWGAGPNAPVPGRSVAVVRLDTGEVIRAFGRAQDLPQALIDAQRTGLVQTPLDSPMTGVPVVYPSQTGAVAQKAFIGDADGTIWRFNLESTNPQEWTGELFLDAYNEDVDTDIAGSWNHGQPVQIAPVVALDRAGRIVLNFATGDQETYTATGTNYVYSVSEVPSGSKLRAQVNWYLGFQNGERVSGPMVVFDGVLYFATFAPAAAQAACSGGTAKLWGRDFVQPKTVGVPADGGVPRLQPPTNPPPNPPDYIEPANYDANLAGKVIPGVSVNVTPACAETTAAPDSYVGGSHTTATNVTSGQYSLFTQVGGKNTSNSGAAISTFSVGLPPPRTATIIDSWASIVE